MRVLVDLDNCVYDFVNELRWFIHNTTGRPLCELPDATCWEFFSEDWGYSLEEFLSLCEQGVNAGILFATGPPVPGAPSALWKLRAKGHTIHIVTDRSFGERSAQNTERWLKDFGIPYDTLTFSRDKTIVSADIAIDDRPTNVMALRAAGCRAYLLRHNGAYLRSDQVDQPYLIDTWGDFLDAVERPAELEPIAVEAHKLVYGARQASYGHPLDDFSRTGRMWAAILDDWRRGDSADIPPELVGLCMVAVKISREVNAPKRDNRVDGAGYFETVDEVHNERSRRAS